jgi:hypothetical protein
VAIFNVSNRQKASGVQYSPESEHVFDPLIAAAIAAHFGPEQHAAVIHELEETYSERWAEWQRIESARPLALEDGTG